jgi:hypothetical protein
MKPTVGTWTALIALALAGHAAAEGLSVHPESVAWPRWQARLGVTTTTQPEFGLTSQLQSTRLFGDYYFTGPGFGQGRFGGGLRATSGLVTGSRSLALSMPTLPSRQGPFSLSARQAQGFHDSADAVPYVGVGYTGVSLRGDLSFTADLGLMGQHGLSRSAAGQNVDDLLRDLRLTPVLQLGVSYSF